MSGILSSLEKHFKSFLLFLAVNAILLYELCYFHTETTLSRNIDVRQMTFLHINKIFLVPVL